MHWFILHCELWLIQIWLNSNMPKFFSFDMVLVKRSFSIIWTFRSSHQRCSMKKGVLGNFPKFTGKHLCRVYFLIKLQARPANLLRRRLWHMCFPVNFEKFLRTPFYIEHLWLLLLYLLHTLFRSKRRAAIVTLFKNKRFISKTTIYTLHYRCNQ